MAADFSINDIKNNSFNLQNPALSLNDGDNEVLLSVFEEENINDVENYNLLNSELKTISLDDDITALLDKMSEVENKQGIITSAWDGFKNLTGLGSSSKKCQKAIEEFKNGKISFNETRLIIEKFDEKQKSSLNLASNLLTGAVSVAMVASAVATGGLSLGVIGLAAGIGAAVKTGFKFFDRATNKVDNDALNAKEITKDALSGALDGALSVATMGIGNTSVSIATVTKQGLKETVAKGALQGAKAGAISGAATGAGDYTISALLDEDCEFKFDDLIKNTTANAVGGALMGGVMGGASSGIQYKSNKAVYLSRKEKFSDLSDDVIVDLSNQAQRLNKSYANKNEAVNNINDIFADTDNIYDISSRVKSTDSIFSKLANKYKKGSLKTINDNECFNSIADAYGFRVQLKSLSSQDALEVVEKSLKGSGLGYDDFVKYINGDVSGLSEASNKYLKNASKNIINELKQKQTQEAVDALIDAIYTNKINISELNNYGDEISSYFTNAQLEQISDMYKYTTNNKLKIVTKLDESLYGNGANISLDGNQDVVFETSKAVFKNKGALKKSGYASSQMNFEQTFSDGTKGLAELQIRGDKLNSFADAEHIVYDIRSGKISQSDESYGSIYKIIKSLSEKDYKSYNKYLGDVFNYFRLKELGIEVAEPVLRKEFSKEVRDMLSYQGLINLKQN